MVIRAPSGICRVVKGEVAGEGTRLRFEGNFDVRAVPAMRPWLEQVVQLECDRLTLDLSRLGLTDVDGVRGLLSLLSLARSRGVVANLTGAWGQPLALLRLLRPQELTAANAPVEAARARGPRRSAQPGAFVLAAA